MMAGMVEECLFDVFETSAVNTEDETIRPAATALFHSIISESLSNQVNISVARTMEAPVLSRSSFIHARKTRCMLRW